MSDVIYQMNKIDIFSVRFHPSGKPKEVTFFPTEKAAKDYVAHFSFDSLEGPFIMRHAIEMDRAGICEWLNKYLLNEELIPR